ncbi:TauD/TfdA family dioxygenase [Roseomonas sp. OT10]|uniref:TauD/TfdA dioxygenase family protein n=1 Tax=Roseomonas cutis TaxID=2897332 RepID=UPI001E50E189|nr:TauD/TfdA family dioxygenase [Roseomonas sp. OT10]UFN46908.1 TauD/TfdA family dioxygenase [Roseomonas sp. OT10]
MYRDPRFTRFEVRPITGALGAEVVGVDLARDRGAETVAELKRALDQHHVLAIRDQALSPELLHAVREAFGPFSGNPVHTPMPGLEDVVRFVREPDDKGKVIGEEWHMDLAWMERPPGITMLWGEVIPPVGGDTCFANLALAYRSLSPGMKSFLEGLTGIHSGKGVFAINAKHQGLTQAGADAVDGIETEHPVVCRHPATGEPYMLVNSVLSRFKGMTEAESRPIIDYLMALAIRPEFTCRVRWAERTLTMWANPFVLHTAIGDYPSYRRVTYRTTVEGPVPIPARGDQVPLGRAA